MDSNKIIVLTPVKNEAWILEQFLRSASLFADCIIVADQKSTDESRNICAKFPKVQLIENKADRYDEASRQVLLIETARQLFPNDKRIFFCLDADELFSADSLTFGESWNRIKSLKQGTSIYIEKPDILYGINRCVRWRDNYFPIGYIDDGLSHTAKTIHSKRIPENPEGEDVYIDDIKILHFAHSRRNVQSAKLRYYSILENINQSKAFYVRRYAYPCFYDENKTYPAENIETMPEEWLKEYDKLGIDLRHLDDPIYSWHDFEILGAFKKYGLKKFYQDDIWEFDWGGCVKASISAGRTDLSLEPIKGPGIAWKALLKVTDAMYTLYRKLKFS